MPKTKEQFNQIKEERRNSILHTALYLFALHGYDAVGVDHVAKASQCSHGLLYHYFKGKDELFQCLMEELCVQKHRELIGMVNTDQKAKFFIQDLLDTYLNAIKSDNTDISCALYLLLTVHLQKNAAPRPKSVGKRKTIFDIFYDNIEKGKEDGDFANNSSKELTISIMAILKGLAYSRIYLGSKKFVCPKSEIIMRMLLK